MTLACVVLAGLIAGSFKILTYAVSYTGRGVNGTAYMDFREATNHLFDGVPHKDLAEALGVSVATVRQARLQDGAKARRSPPLGWEAGVIKLATEQIQRYGLLISNLSKDAQQSLFTNGKKSESSTR